MYTDCVGEGYYVLQVFLDIHSLCLSAVSDHGRFPRGGVYVRYLGEDDLAHVKSFTY